MSWAGYPDSVLAYKNADGITVVPDSEARRGSRGGRGGPRTAGKARKLDSAARAEYRECFRIQIVL